MWLNVKHIEERLDNENLQEITIKYHSGHRNHGYKRVTETKKQCNRTFIDKNLAIKVIMDCRTTSTHKFRTRSGSGSVLTRIMSSFEEVNMQTQ